MVATNPKFPPPERPENYRPKLKAFLTAEEAADLEAKRRTDALRDDFAKIVAPFVLEGLKDNPRFDIGKTIWAVTDAIIAERSRKK